MDQCTIYEYAKQVFMRSGHVCSWEELVSEFPEIDRLEIKEAINHFHEIIKDWTPDNLIYKQNGDNYAAQTNNQRH